MAVKRWSLASISIAEGTDEDVERFIERDFNIRSGNCPNGCGKLAIIDPPYVGQECLVCKFSCNTLPEVSQ